MPRIRTIKPEFWSSPDTAEASPVARLTFIAMWNWADDYGRGTLNLKELEGFIFPNDDVAELVQGTSDTKQGSSAHFRDTVKEVVTVFGLNVYEVDRRTYYEIPSWDGHQRTERKAKKCNPTPDQGKYVTDQWTLGEARKRTDVPTHKQGTSAHFRDSDKEVLGNVEIGKGKGKGSEPSPSPEPDSLDALADAHAQATHHPVAPGVYGTPDEPRCERHQGNPNPPACGGCANARRWFEKQQAAIDAQAQAEREAERRRADNCPYCEGGWRKGTNPAQRCNHQDHQENAA